MVAQVSLVLVGRGNAMRWIGIDLHQLFVHVTELSDAADPEHYRLPVSEAGLAELKSHLGPDACAVVEASTGSFRLCDELSPHLRRMVVAHPAQTRGASPTHVKTDRRDSEVLARLLASDCIREVWVPPPPLRALRYLLEYREILVKMHSGMVNRVRTNFRAELLPYPDGLSSQKLELARDAQWPHPYTTLLMRSILDMAQSLKKQLRVVDAALAKWSRDNEQAQLLQTIPGIGPIIAAQIVGQIGDVHRFATPARLCAYGGLVPTVHASGKKLHIGGVTQRGRRRLRQAIWTAAMVAVRCGGRFGELFERLTVRRPKMVARVACARKLLTIIWHMLRSGEPYRDASGKKKRQRRPASLRRPPRARPRRAAATATSSTWSGETLRRQYSPTERARAVKLANQMGPQAASKALSIPMGTIAYWQHVARQRS